MATKPKAPPMEPGKFPPAPAKKPKKPAAC